ncbi:MAG: aldehyde dehydrogenase family protein [Agarilytica sp.]
MNIYDIFQQLGIDGEILSQGENLVFSPINGSIIANIHHQTLSDVNSVIENSQTAFQQWRQVPPPRRGELVRVFGNKLRAHKETLGKLVTIECGKIYQEGLGEVQEMIDICDFATGLSRQLYGLTIASERLGHKMQEVWHPMGPVGVISAFNFPVAVWAWNAALAWVCGNSVIWKPSEKTPLTAFACHHLFLEACQELDDIPHNLSQIIIGDSDIGEALVADKRIPIISATGSCAMGRKVGPIVAQRFGRSILELGGNNAVIVAPTADLEMAARGILFGAVGTAGQRCTTTRRLFVHENIYDMLVLSLQKSYHHIVVGNPLHETTLVGPLIDANAFEQMQAAIIKAKDLGGIVHGGERLDFPNLPDAYYVKPCIIEMPNSEQSIQEETFAPILYVYLYTNLTHAIHLQNDVPQGLSSAIFTNDVREAELFSSSVGSDCGIANINIGTSGAEIGGAFGGEKETGGGRESGSDAWKSYMRRMTSTINYSSELPLAQGIKFD